MPDSDTAEDGVDRLAQLDDMTLTEWTHEAEIDARILLSLDVPAEDAAENLKMAIEDYLSDVPSTVGVSVNAWERDTENSPGGEGR